MERIFCLATFVFAVFIFEQLFAYENEGILQWSEKAPTEMEWRNAINYCNTLDEGGHKDWRLPNIDELRTLIQNCPGTVTGGECKVSAESGCLSEHNCWQRSCFCDRKNQSDYSKLGDKGGFWSSSPVSDWGFNEWAVIFDSAGINATYATGDGADSHSVRCVRNNKKSKSTKETSKTENLQWSEKSSVKMNWNDAVNYCKKLNEGAYYDWRLPNIDELRTLIINHSGTEPNGTCQISEKGGRLGSGDRFDSVCQSLEFNINHSKLGDTGKKGDSIRSLFMWSSSIQSDRPNKEAWGVDFTGGGISYRAKNYDEYVRCVRDNKTYLLNQQIKKEQEKTENLQWSEKAPSMMNWNSAINYCKNLKENDYRDWRLPNIDELRTLITNSGPETNGTCKISEKSGKLAYGDWTSDCLDHDKAIINKLGDSGGIWSSSVLSDATNDSAWCLNDFMISPAEKFLELHLRCVRGQQTITKSKESKNSKGLTKIGEAVWSAKSSAEMNWDDAVNYCKNLDEGGYKDWKLPNIDELRTLIQNCPGTVTSGGCKVSEKTHCLNPIQKNPKCYLSDCHSCPVDSTGGYSKLGDINWLWSSSARPDMEDYAWGIYFYGGNLSQGPKSGNNYVRCVRY